MVVIVGALRVIVGFVSVGELGVWLDVVVATGDIGCCGCGCGSNTIGSLPGYSGRFSSYFSSSDCGTNRPPK